MNGRTAPKKNSSALVQVPTGADKSTVSDQLAKVLMLSCPDKLNPAVVKHAPPVPDHGAKPSISVSHKTTTANVGSMTQQQANFQQ